MECCICWEKSGYVCTTSCKHNICAKCLLKMNKLLCPLCRKNLSQELGKEQTDSSHISHNIEDYPGYTQEEIDFGIYWSEHAWSESWSNHINSS